MYRPYGILYFTLGVALRLYGIPAISMRHSMVLLTIGMGIIATLNMLTRGDDGALIGVNWLLEFASRPAILLGVYVLMPASPWPKILTSNTFAIYALHPPVEHVLFNLAMKFGMWNHVFGNFVPSVLFIAFLVLITCGVAQLARKTKLTALLILGGR